MAEYLARFIDAGWEPAPPATEQRYWRVCPTGWGNVFIAYECDASGRVTLSLGGGSRAEAEADGTASGLPRWDGGGK